MKDFDCKGTYTDCYICNDLCATRTRKECQHMAKAKRTTKKETAAEKKKRLAAEAKAEKEKKAAAAAAEEEKTKKEETAEEEIALATLEDAIAVEALAVFEAKKHPAIPTIHAFLAAIQYHKLTFEQKTTYLKFRKQPDNKVIFYLFLSRKPQIEVKATKEDLEPIKGSIAKVATNVFVKMETPQEATAVGSFLMEHFEVANKEEGEEPEEKTKEEEAPPKKAPQKSAAVLIGQNILNGLKDGDLAEEDLDDADDIELYLAGKDVDIPDDFDLAAFLGKLKTKLAKRKEKK